MGPSHVFFVFIPPFRDKLPEGTRYAVSKPQRPKLSTLLLPEQPL